MMRSFDSFVRLGNGGVTRRPSGADVTMAFQPIVDAARREVYSYEALVRGRNGECAAQVMARVGSAGRYAFDQTCRIKAIAWAAKLEIPTRLDVNFMPNALDRAETCITTTVRAARHYGFPADRIVFEATECERIADVRRVAAVVRECQRQGMRFAIDDFGSGYAGLNVLAELQPDLIKLDIGLCRGIDTDRHRRAIVHGVLCTCADLEIEVVAEGVETRGEFAALYDLGVQYFQGYLFARPAFEALPEVRWPLTP
jgi:EAL domain-containing protein (putative c-di-GMP-specific phosphodiesterase class I)